MQRTETDSRDLADFDSQSAGTGTGSGAGSSYNLANASSFAQ